MQDELTYEAIECVEINDCCKVSKKNLYSEIVGYLNEEDEFITKEETEKYKDVLKKEKLYLFVIRIYKCVDCGKWEISVLEDE